MVLYIPGMAILAGRHIPVPPQCPVCSQGPEDIRHLIFTCKRAKGVWQTLGNLPVINSALVDRSGSIVLEELLRNQQPNSTEITDLKELIVVGAWYIWWQRREYVKRESIAQPRQTAFAIQALKSNYCVAQAKTQPKEIIWSKPKLNSYKLNIDACFFPNGSGATGAIIRNDKGEAIAGSSYIPYKTKLRQLRARHLLLGGDWS